MSSEYSRMYKKFKPYIENPYTDQTIVRKMKDRLSWANTVEDKRKEQKG